jgi:3,4-dihydroxy 2-butanone 4-phosphate synthase / GTP cyclohydrolase II
MEAAVDLAMLAGLPPAGVVAEVVSDADPTGMAGAQELRSFADEHALALVSIADLIAHRRRLETLVRRAASARVSAAARRVHRRWFRHRPTTTADTSRS